MEDKLNSIDKSGPDPDKIYPRTGDKTICYLKNIFIIHNIIIGDY